MTNKKKIITTTAAMAAVTAGAVAINANTAHADTVSTEAQQSSTVQQPQAENAQQQAQDKYVQAKHDLNTAQGNLNQAQSQANTTQTALNQASDAQQKAQDESNKANQQESQASQAVNAAQNTLTNAEHTAHDATSQNINDASQAASQANQAVNNAQTNVNDAQQTVNQAQTDLNNAQANAKSAQDQVNQDQQAINQASQAMDTQGAKKALDDANAELNTAKTNQTNAHQAVTNAQKDVNNKQSAANQAQTAANSASSQEATTKQALDTANTNVNDKQSKVTQAQQALDNAQHQSTTGSVTDPASWGITVTATQDAKNAANQAKQQGSADYDLKERMLNGLTVTYTPSSHDRSVVLTNTSIMYAIHGVLNSLTTNNWQLNIQIQEFLAAMLNGIHQALGIDNTVIPNEALMRDASTFANNPQFKNTPWGTRVNYSGLHTQSATEFNGSVTLSYGDENNPHQGFNVNGYNYGLPGHNLDLSNLKSLFGTILLKGIDGEGGPTWSHLSQQNNIASDLILGTNLNNGTKTYFGVAFQNSTEQGGMYNGFYETAEDAQVFDPAVANATTYGLSSSSTADTNALQAALKNTQTALNDAQTQQRQAQAAYNTAHQAKTKADSQLKSAQNALASAQTKLTSAQNSAQASDRAVASAQSKVEQAQQAYNNAQADAATKQAKLQATKDQLVKDQASLNTAQTQVAQATTALTNAKSALASAQNDLKTKQDSARTANQRLQDLQNAQANLARAREALQTAQDNLTRAQERAHNAQSALNLANDTLAKAQAANDKAQEALKAAQNDFTQKQAAFNQAKANLISDAKQYGDNVKIKNPNITITEGDHVPAPELDNTFIKTRENSEVDSLLSDFATITGGDLPEGTTIAWSNPAKVNNDANHAGEYNENVTITFPDGSTVTRQINMTVKYNPALHRNEATLPAGTRIQGDHLIDTNGNVVPGYKVVNGQVVKTTNTAAGSSSSVNYTAPTTSAVTMTREQYRTSQNNKTNTDAKTLPQTGNHSALSSIALGVAGLMAGIGLAGADKKHKA